MKNKKKLEKLIENNNGTVVSSDLEKYDIPRSYLQFMVAEGKLERVERGIYVSTNSVEDIMFAMQSKYPQLIYSHETALYIHGLTDRTPNMYSATVPSGYKVVENIQKRFKLYYIKKELHDLGVSEYETSFGNHIRSYNVERTICDIIRSRSRIDIQILSAALREFVELKSVDFSLLSEYSRKLKVEKILNNYLEVLL